MNIYKKTPVRKIDTIPSLKKGAKQENFRYVQEYLVRFGYLKPNTFTFDVLDEATSDGLKKFQRACERRPLGIFNKVTRKEMTEHRCAHPDLLNGIGATTECTWDKQVLRFCFSGGSKDVPDLEAFEAVRNAFRTWENEIPLTFLEVQPHLNPDIEVDWRPVDDPDLVGVSELPNMRGGTVAHADFPGNCAIVTNSVPKPLHFDDEEHTWIVGQEIDKHDIETVSLHEIGHILGLGHSTSTSDVMHHRIQANFIRRSLSTNDITRIHDLYVNHS